MANTITVIVSRFTNNRIYGPRLLDVKTQSLDDAFAIGKDKTADGMSVIVRPNYNETDSKGRFFREWRSFNGEPFKEVRWEFPGNE